MNYFERFVMRHADFFEAVERSPHWDTFIAVGSLAIAFSLLIASASA